MKKPLLFLIICLVSMNCAAATTYYVTQLGAGTHLGQDVGNAWSIVEFNAKTNLAAGSVVHFIGTFTSTVSPSASGTGNGVGRLTMDFSAATLNTANPRININGQNYLNIKGGVFGTASEGNLILFNNQQSHDITIQNWVHTGSDTSTCSFIYGQFVYNLLVTNNTAINTANLIWGDTINNHDIIISNNLVITSQNKVTQTDIVVFGDAYNVVIEGNKFIMQTEGSISERHNDIIQCYQKGGSNSGNPYGWIIRYNWFELDVRTGSGDTSWFMLENMKSNGATPAAKIYSNIFVGADTDKGSNNGMAVHANDASAVFYFYGNTVIRKDGPDNTIRFLSPGTLYAENNLAAANPGISGTFLSWTMTKGVWDHNWFYNFQANSAYTGAHGGTSDPQLANYGSNDYSPAPGSKLRGAGDSSIGSEYSKGIAPGATWPNPTIVYRSAWDIGAYEFTNAQSCSEIGGTCCSSGQTCSGTTQTASDCAACCTGTCQSTCIPGDLNCDKKVDIFDLVLVAQNYGKTSGFDNRADANKDGKIDIFDLVMVAQNYGKNG